MSHGMRYSMRQGVQRDGGFSLVELILVIVLIGIIGGVLTMQLAPAIQSYLLISQRAGLTSQADTALRRITTEVRAAVPNSLRLNNPQCLDLVPTRDGGRYRMGPDTVNPDDAHINDAETGAAFDVLTPLNAMPTPGDAIVIGNRSPDDVYSGSNVGTVSALAGPSPNAQAGISRIMLNAPIQIPQGYDGGRFLVVPGNERVVTYVCTQGVDQATGNGTGFLTRFSRTTPGATTCNAPAGTSAIVATRVSACSFVVYTNQGATQDSGFVQLQLTLTERGESVPLTIGTHVDNLP
jgi:MSHA biogenesis protein MshO